MLKQPEIKITLCLPLDWSQTPKSELEFLIEQSTAKKEFCPANLENQPGYKHLTLLGIDDAAREVIETITKRYMMFCRTLPAESKIALDHILKKLLESQKYKSTETKNKLKTFLNDDQIAAFQHIKNAYSSIAMAIFLAQELEGEGEGEGSLGIKMLYTGLHELYSGTRRFFKEQIKTRSEVATKGGLARKEHYLPTKQKACELLNTLAPQEGWNEELDAYKAILPEIKKYLEENDIKRPAMISIEKTLRRWIKNDPIVSAAVRIAQFPAHNSSTD
ncbi:hypothetical protein BJ917_6145 [Pseudomonas sp. WPR_5_2]|uniref:hypothetical protein n=1 Tax=Pseudomonas sp. WPR_5_2 TaxID=1907371 RepID=UPI000F11A591|nr:hypothetical protein [Pseudomonas sp. WPR_5_2]RKS12227.1 hypothetical protein BJ917_6145 [Pseudomonas sp. WPR_5_2]